MITSRRLTLAATGAVLTAIAPLLATPAYAGDGDIIKRGSCTMGAEWKLKAGPQDGRIEVEGEVDSNRSGQTWRWRIIHNGTLSASGTATTQPPSGSFSVRRVLVDVAGTDSIVWRATRSATGETCRGVVTF